MKQVYDTHMRTTISLDDALGKAARRRAREQGLSLSAFMAKAVRALLAEEARPAARRRPFRLVTVGGGGPQPGVDLDRTSGLIVADDEAAYGEPPGRSR
jgi:hypothetical protein